MAVLLFLIIIPILFIIRNIKIEIINPIFAYCLVWSGMIFIYQLNVFSNFPDISIFLYIFIFSTIFIFILGSYLGGKITIPDIPIKYSFNKMRKIRDYILCVVISSFLFTILKLGLPPSLGGTIPRVDYYIGYVEIFYLLIYSLWFITLYLLINKKFIKSNISILIITLLIIILKGNKFPFVMLLVMGIYFLSIDRRIKLKHLYLVSIGVMIMFVLASTLYLNSSDLNYYRAIQVGYTLPESLYVIMDPLLYVSNNLMNLDSFIHQNIDYTYGLRMISNIIKLLGLTSFFQEKFDIVEIIWTNSLRIPWLTTGTYLKDVYIDFGYIGMLIFPFFFGGFSGFYFKKQKRSEKNISINTRFIYFLLYVSIILSFFTWYLRANEIIVNTIVIFFVDKICRERTNSI